MDTTSELPFPSDAKRGLAFWLIILSLCTNLFLYALELTAVSTALPTIVDDLHSSDFVWVGAAYTLASTAFLPISGGLAQIFGRRPAIMVSIVCFALGSALCGAATSTPLLITGRALQGLGGGGVLALADILLADLVPLKQRGNFFGLFGLTWSVALSIGPIVGGALATAGAWRWLFYLNIPLCAVAFGLVWFFLKVRAPGGTIVMKLRRVDWLGNFLVVSGSSTLALALSWAGTQFNWGSAPVLVPLCFGVVLLCMFVLHERLWAREPIVPFSLLSTRTSLSGYVQDFLAAILALATLYYLPVYYQACKEASPFFSGVLTLGLAAIAPAAIVSGMTVTFTQQYRPPIYFGWILSIIGFSLMTTVHADTANGLTVGYSVLVGVGLGTIYALTSFPVLAPLPVSSSALALAFFAFMRSMGGIWGVTVGNAIVQNELRHRLSPAFLASLPEGVSIVYALIPKIPTLSQPLQDEVRASFAQSLVVLWKFLAAVSGVGLVSCFLMQEIPMQKETDEMWGLEKTD